MAYNINLKKAYIVFSFSPTLLSYWSYLVLKNKLERWNANGEIKMKIIKIT